MMMNYDTDNMTIEELETRVCWLNKEIEKRKTMQRVQDWDNVIIALNDFFEKYGFINLEIIRPDSIEYFELDYRAKFNIEENTITIIE